MASSDGLRDIACDLDGTLAYYDRWRGIAHIGAPIPGTLARVKMALAAGHRVEIFTARVAFADDVAEVVETIRYIERWCLEHVGRVLPVTATKQGYFDEFWDDKAVSVGVNDGCGYSCNQSLWDSLLREVAS